MSNHATGLVWKSGLYEGHTLLLLLKLADYADDEGWCWPSRARIGKMTGIDTRSVTRIVKRLQDDGALEVSAGVGRGRVNRYRVRMEFLAAAGAAWTAMDMASSIRFADAEKMTQSPLFRALNGDTRSPFIRLKGGAESSFADVKGDSGNIKGDSGDRKGDRGVPQNPSVNPLEESAGAAAAPLSPDEWAAMRQRIKSQIGQEAFVAGVSALRLVHGRVTASSQLAAIDVARRHAATLKAAGLVAIYGDDGQEVAL